MKLIACMALLLSIPQMVEAKSSNVNRVYAEVLLTDIVNDTSKAWYREELNGSNSLVEYPIELARDNLRGCTILSLDITEDGTTENVEVVSSIPNKQLGKYSKKLVKRWRWQQIESQKGVKAESRVLRFDYCLGIESAEQTLAQCQRQTTLNCG